MSKKDKKIAKLNCTYYFYILDIFKSIILLYNKNQVQRSEDTIYIFCILNTYVHLQIQ